MIYLASDDRYFIVGIKALFRTINTSVTLIDLFVVEEHGVFPVFTRRDTLILAVESNDLFIRLLVMARSRGTKALLILDNACKNTEVDLTLFPPRLLSKKMPFAVFVPLLEAGVAYLKDLSFLTTQEINVMCHLARGEPSSRVARALHLSMKTIYSHKYNSLRKLGLDHLNSRSIVLFGLLFQGLSTVNVRPPVNVRGVAYAGVRV